MTDREGAEITYTYDALNRITKIHRPGGISTYNTYNAGNQITELVNVCDDCQWVISSYRYTYDDRGFITAETAVEFLADADWTTWHKDMCDGFHGGKRHDGHCSVHEGLWGFWTGRGIQRSETDVYLKDEDCHSQEHHHKDHDGHCHDHHCHKQCSTHRGLSVETTRTFTYDDAGKLLASTEAVGDCYQRNYSYEYDLAGNRTSQTVTDGKNRVVESHRYTYNESNQLVKECSFENGKTTQLTYTYDADGNLILETEMLCGRYGTVCASVTR